jgi:hypothetical protein
MLTTIDIDADAALVLFELLASNKDLATQLKLNAPERNALWVLEAVLEKKLVAPLHADYTKKLADARLSLVERFGE